MGNKEWSDRLLLRFDPLFKHRWTIYKTVLNNLLSESSIWIDCGCGNNEMVETFRKSSKFALGLDIVDNTACRNFLKADIKNLPLKASSVNLITLRFVVEHFDNKFDYFDEIGRVLQYNGVVLILTTNLYSPIIFLPKILLPKRLKEQIISLIFKVQEEDIFPAYHNYNTLKKFEGINGFKVKEVLFLSDLNYTLKIIFLLLFIWHMITKIKGLKYFRSNLLIVLEKSFK